MPAISVLTPALREEKSQFWVRITESSSRTLTLVLLGSVPSACLLTHGEGERHRTRNPSPRPDFSAAFFRRPFWQRFTPVRRPKGFPIPKRRQSAIREAPHRYRPGGQGYGTRSWNSARITRKGDVVHRNVSELSISRGVDSRDVFGAVIQEIWTFSNRCAGMCAKSLPFGELRTRHWCFRSYRAARHNRSRKVDSQSGLCGQALVLGELLAVVQGQRSPQTAGKGQIKSVIAWRTVEACRSGDLPSRR